MGSLSKSKRLQTSRSLDPLYDLEASPKVGSSPKASKRVEKARSGLQSSPRQKFITRLASIGSLKSKRTKSDIVPQVLQPQRPGAPHNAEEELEMAFNVFDMNRDGQISITELGAVLRCFSGEVSEQELQLIMKDVDKNQDGFISLEEFKAVNNYSNFLGDNGSPHEDPIRKAFETFDKDGNSLISADELRAVLQNMGDKAHSLEDCRRMISQVDQDGDGFVNYKEFQILLGAQS